MGVQRCWQHLKLHWKLRIRDTGTPMRLGLFAVGRTNNPREIVFKDGDIITDFLGELIQTDDHDDRYGRETSPYAFYDPRSGWITDPACRRGVGSFINHKPRGQANSKFGFTRINRQGYSEIRRTVIRQQKT